MVTETPISFHVMNQMAAFFFFFFRFFYIQESFYDEEESLGPPVSSSLFSESLCVGAAPSDDSTVQKLPLSEFQLVL